MDINPTRPDLPKLTLHERELSIDGHPILTEMPASACLLPDPHAVGTFLRVTANEAGSRLELLLGVLSGFQRFTACHRFEPFFMSAASGQRAGQIPVETQSLLLELEDLTYVLLIPLIDGLLRCCLQGTNVDQLELVAESGDPAITGQEITGLFVAAGENPYTLVEQAAMSVNSWLGTGRLRRTKPLPAFIDTFGWCTWDAFYQDVSHSLVRQGLESFAAGGVQPRFLLLDDGWQSEHTLPAGERRLTAFNANVKFSGDLAPTIRMAKEQFGIQTFLVWHALLGYWGGADSSALTGYGIHTEQRDWSAGILHYFPDYNQKWGNQIGMIPPEEAYRFFHDYHRHLRAQGVDGVKVDNQAVLEAVCKGSGGRVQAMQMFHEALEGSVQTHFLGNLMNCMSSTNEMIYAALNSTLMRTSIDFWPNLPESHSLHLYVNAQVGLWFGEFIHPDWDMFQSGHPMGELHAMARAVSGGPVYVSDKPGIHDFDLLRKLVLPDGSVLRAQKPGRPTRDCLFGDPVKEPVIFKVFNHNLQAGIIGAFNLNYARRGSNLEYISGSISPADVEGLSGERFAVLEHHTRQTRVLGRQETWQISLPTLTGEVFTIVPIQDGIAPLGLVDLFNASAAILEKGCTADQRYRLRVLGGGACWIYSESQPWQVRLNSQPVVFQYQNSTIRLDIPKTGINIIDLEL